MVHSHRSVYRKTAIPNSNGVDATAKQISQEQNSGIRESIEEHHKSPDQKSDFLGN
jgi:hypothetical protein